jgi:anaerobic selenocysteine-containing dehydrogenase
VWWSNGIFTKALPDKEHPNSVGALCPKALAGPELVYSEDRLLYPMKRTRPKGDSDPGWQRISWEEALPMAAQRLNEIKEKYGAEAVAFHRSSNGGSQAADFNNWALRLGYSFGSPNNLSTTHISTVGKAADRAGP